MKSRLTADVAETYPFRNLFDDENQARIVLSLEKPFEQSAAVVEAKPIAALEQLSHAP
jgi:hypothetical protein